MNYTAFQIFVIFACLVLQPMSDGRFMVVLRVLEFHESDALVNFKVSVANEVGVRDFRITISNDKPPHGKLNMTPTA